jgi:hypothetical protein
LSATFWESLSGEHVTSSQLGLFVLNFSHSVGRGFKKYSRAACILRIFQISWFIYKAHEKL